MTGKEIFMTYTQIEEAYNNYLAIEPYLSDKDKLHYLRAFQELIKLFKLNVELETMADNM